MFKKPPWHALCISGAGILRQDPSAAPTCMDMLPWIWVPCGGGRGKQGNDGEPGSSFWERRVSAPLWGLGIKLHPLKKGHKHQQTEDGAAVSRGLSAPSRMLEGFALPAVNNCSPPQPCPSGPVRSQSFLLPCFSPGKPETGAVRSWQRSPGPPQKLLLILYSPLITRKQ